MRRFFTFFPILLILLSLLDCQSRKDESLDKAVFNFILLCPGGSASACESTCANQYGENVTTENLTAVNRCVSSCQSNCNLQNIFLLLEAGK